MVLLSTTPGAPDSLPVLLLTLARADLARQFEGLLLRLMTPVGTVLEQAQRPASPVTVDGIDVAELAPEEAELYFGSEPG